MEIYNSENKCPKCLGKASVEYEHRGFRRGELKRVCLTCGYVWYEKGLDYSKKED